MYKNISGREFMLRCVVLVCFMISLCVCGGCRQQVVQSKGSDLTAVSSVAPDTVMHDGDTATIKVTNNSKHTDTFAIHDAPDDIVVTSNTATNLKPGEEGEIKIAYKPKVTVGHAHTITVAGKHGGSRSTKKIPIKFDASSIVCSTGEGSTLARAVQLALQR
jgi:hypothetical protein